MERENIEGIGRDIWERNVVEKMEGGGIGIVVIGDIIRKLLKIGDKLERKRVDDNVMIDMSKRKWKRGRKKMECLKNEIGRLESGIEIIERKKVGGNLLGEMIIEKDENWNLIDEKWNERKWKRRVEDEEGWKRKKRKEKKKN